jgi:hypothetical protein
MAKEIEKDRRVRWREIVQCPYAETQFFVFLNAYFYDNEPKMLVFIPIRAQSLRHTGIG